LIDFALINRKGSKCFRGIGYRILWEQKEEKEEQREEKRRN
jgi:hypothetical protein